MHRNGRFREPRPTRLPEAIETTRQALEVARQAGDEKLVRELQARLASYEAAAGAASSGPSRTRSRRAFAGSGDRCAFAVDLAEAIY